MRAEIDAFAAKYPDFDALGDLIVSIMQHTPLGLEPSYHLAKLIRLWPKVNQVGRREAIKRAFMRHG